MWPPSLLTIRHRNHTEVKAKKRERESISCCSEILSEFLKGEEEEGFGGDGFRYRFHLVPLRRPPRPQSREDWSREAAAAGGRGLPGRGHGGEGPAREGGAPAARGGAGEASRLRLGRRGAGPRARGGGGPRRRGRPRGLRGPGPGAAGRVAAGDHGSGARPVRIRHRHRLQWRGGRGADRVREADGAAVPGVQPGHGETEPGDVPAVRQGGEALRHPHRVHVPGRRRGAGAGARQGPLLLLRGRPPGVLPGAQGAAAPPRAARAQGVDHRPAEGPVARDARQHPRRPGRPVVRGPGGRRRQPGQVEPRGQRRRQGRVDVPPHHGRPRERPARAGVRVDRVRAVHEARAAGAAREGREVVVGGRHGEGVRPAQGEHRQGRPARGGGGAQGQRRRRQRQRLGGRAGHLREQRRGEPHPRRRREPPAAGEPRGAVAGRAVRAVVPLLPGHGGVLPGARREARRGLRREGGQVPRRRRAEGVRAEGAAAAELPDHPPLPEPHREADQVPVGEEGRRLAARLRQQPPMRETIVLASIDAVLPGCHTLVLRVHYSLGNSKSFRGSDAVAASIAFAATSQVNPGSSLLSERATCTS